MAEPDAGEMTRAFVVGHPISHSRSPLIHGAWLELYGLAGSYERVDVAPQAFSEFVASLAARGFAGGNVTLPHKEAALRLVARLDGAATRIGAVNTLWFEDGVLCGGNTDAYGFAASMDADAPEWRDTGTALVLGAGGAARAILHALIKAGIGRITVVNRTEERARELAALFGPRVEPHGWDRVQHLAASADLVVNTTSLGMGSDSRSPLDVERLHDGAIVSDIVYVPLRTALLEAAAARGLRVVEGLGMLLHQAVPGFERWFGVRPQVTPTLRALVEADVAGPR